MVHVRYIIELTHRQVAGHCKVDLILENLGYGKSAAVLKNRPLAGPVS